MDLRPQSHEIIRTWLFSTMVRSELEFGSLPWSDAAISGWILDPDRKKMSKSKGNNVVTPTDLLEQYGSDAVRYWSASGRYGVDTVFDVGQLKVGRRLAIKILNASKFVLSLDGAVGPITAAVDLSLLAGLDGVVRSATSALASYDHAGALAAIERFFWMFCDDYLELVKARAYGSGAQAASGTEAASARGALRAALSVLLRLFAPFLPFVTEEAWSWWQEGSVHRAAWPSGDADLAGAERGNPAVLQAAATVLGQIRKAKTAAKVSMRAEAARVVVRGPDAEVLLACAGDLRAAGNIDDLSVVPAPGGEPTTEVTLAAPDA
jgi:valyl-tRNA synthetase